MRANLHKLSWRCSWCHKEFHDIHGVRAHEKRKHKRNMRDEALEKFRKYFAERTG